MVRGGSDVPERVPGVLPPRAQAVPEPPQISSHKGGTTLRGGVHIHRKQRVPGLQKIGSSGEKGTKTWNVCTKWGTEPRDHSKCNLQPTFPLHNILSLGNEPALQTNSSCQ